MVFFNWLKSLSLFKYAAGAAIGALLTYFLLPTVEVKTQDVKTTEKRVVERVIEKKDGTKVTEIVTETKKIKDKSKVAEVNKVSSEQAKSQYRVGVGYGVLPGKEEVVAGASARIANSPVWLDANYFTRSKTVTIGVSYEW